MTLTEFLLARIAEDEVVSREGGSGEWAHEGQWHLEGVEHEVVGPDEVAFTHVGYADHIARHDPARVLAECEAKRRIVQPYKSGGGEYGAGYDAAFEDVLSLLALPYADHPDYREEWKP